MRTIGGNYFSRCNNPKLDIAVHLPVLKEYGKECRHITEMGVRRVTSTWAFLMARPLKLVSIDWDHEPFQVCRETLNEAKDLAHKAGIIFEFRAASTTDVVIEETDLLFIDTWHTYEQLMVELLLHADNTRKYIIAHDTNEAIFPGMLCGVEDFVNLNPQWSVEKIYTESPGMTILKRVGSQKTNWGDFNLDNLLEEVHKQQDLFFESCTEIEGPVSEGWKKYRQGQYEQFSNKDRWPKTLGV